MVEKRAFAWQESTGNLKSFHVPVLLLHLFLFFDLWLHKAAAGLNDETHLGGHAEVAHDQKLQLLQEGFTGKLVLIAVGLHEVLHPYWLDLHDVTNIEVEDPLVLVQEPKYCSHVNEISILLLD